MRTKNKFKIAIIGAGPAGSATAFLLKTLGHEVVLFEQKNEIKRRVCGEYLCPMGVDLLKKHGFIKLSQTDFLPLKGMILSDVKNQTVIKASFPTFSSTSLGLSLNRQKFDQALIDLCLSHGVEVHFGYKLIELNHMKKLWKLKFENNKEFEFDFLIAADGRNSHIGRLLGHAPKVDSSRIALHAYLPRKTDHGVRFGEMHIFSDGSYCGLNPIQDHEVNFSIVLDSNEVKAKKDLVKIINERISRSDRLKNLFDFISPETEIKTSSPLSHKNPFIAGNNIAYVGDASGFVDPLTGEGIANALLSADLLYYAMLENESLAKALKVYRQNKIQAHRQKLVLNTIFQFVIRKPVLVTLLAKFLKEKEERANIFIGIIGNIFTPIEGILRFIGIKGEV